MTSPATYCRLSFAPSIPYTFISYTYTTFNSLLHIFLHTTKYSFVKTFWVRRISSDKMRSVYPACTSLCKVLKCSFKSRKCAKT